jgi:hypothetical protein
LPLTGNASLLKPNPAFIAGAKYYRRTGVRNGDIVLMNDCGARTYNTITSECGTAATIEAAFPQVLGVAYNLGDGTLQTIQGLRAWVANTALPTNVSATPSSLVLVEIGGKVYRGLLQRDGAPIRTRLADGTISDVALRFNEQAMQSLQAAVAF